MSEEQQIDPILQENLEDAQTSDPLLPKNDYEVEVVKVEQQRNKKDTGNLIYLELKTTADCTAVTGEPVPAGRRLFHRIGLTATPEYPVSSIQRNLKRFQVCFVAGFKGQMHPLEQWVGMRGIVTVGFSKQTDDFPEQRNEIKAFKEKRV